MYTVDEITAIGKKVLLLVKAYVTLYLGSTEQEMMDLKVKTVNGLHLKAILKLMYK